MKIDKLGIWLVIVGIITLSVAGVGVVIYYRKQPSKKLNVINLVNPITTPSLLSNNTVQVSESEDKILAFDLGVLVSEMLQCQYKQDGRYPYSLDSLSQKCVPSENVKNPSMVTDMESFKYQTDGQGQDFYFEVPVSKTKKYTVTKDKIKFSE
jgi:hypothetical protein